MSGLQKHVHRRDTEAERVARLASKMQEYGYTNGSDEPPGSNAPAGLNASVSRRQATANQARIPAAYRASRSASPALSAGAGGRQDKDAGMAPPRYPASLLHANARSISDPDPFDTDVENADATTTISDVGTLDDASQSWNRFRGNAATMVNQYPPDGPEYEESLPPGLGDEQYAESRPDGRFDYNTPEMEGASVDEGSSDQGSIDDQSHYGEAVDPRLLDENARSGYAEAAFSRVPETPKTRTKTLQSMMESPSTKKIVMRAKDQNGYHSTRPLTAKPPLEAQQRVNRDHSQVLQPVLSQYPPQQTSRETRRDFPQESAAPLVQQPLLEKTNSWSVDHVRHPEQHGTQGTSFAEHVVPMQVFQKEQLQFQPLATSDKILDAEKPTVLPRDVLQRSKTPQEEHGVSAQAVDDDKGQLNHDTYESKSAEVHVIEKQPALKANAGTKKADQRVIQKGAAIPAKPQSKEPESRKRRRSLDYTREEMSGMSYKLLNSESFDHIPKPGPNALPSELAKASLPEKLKYTYELKDREDSKAQRRTVFASMTIEQYEETGDLIIGQFSSILGRYKEARQGKRQVGRVLEKEIAHREERVREKTNLVEEDLKRLKRGAEDVVRGSGKGSSP